MKYQVSFVVKTLYPHTWKRKEGYLHTGRNHRCYGYIINSAFHNKKILVWFFNVFFLVKNISLVLFVSSRDHAISSTFEPLLTTTSPQQSLFLVDSVVSTSLQRPLSSVPNKVAVMYRFNCISLTRFGYNQRRRNFSSGVCKIIITDLLYLKRTENGK